MKKVFITLGVLILVVITALMVIPTFFKGDILQIIEKQSTEIDGVTGATITTDAIKNAVNDALKQAGLR